MRFACKSAAQNGLDQKMRPPGAEAQNTNSSGTAGLEGLLHPARVYSHVDWRLRFQNKNARFEKSGEDMGRNEVSGFVCNESRWGHMGRNRVSPLEMGTMGGGRVSTIPMGRKIANIPEN